MKSTLHIALGATATLVFLLGAGLWYTQSAEARLEVLAIGAAMPEFSLEDSTGKTSSEIVRWMEHMSGIEIKK